MRWILGCSSFLSLFAAFSTPAFADIADELIRVPGMTLIEEQPEPIPGYRFFRLSYAQPVDHNEPSRGTFEQRLTLLHRSESAPTVAFTTGYSLRGNAFRSEPTALVDGNQVVFEERFFAESVPEPADYADLDIFQAASDHHRVIEALKPLYPGKWLSTGASKGGMATVYHRRFFEGDIDGSIVYVAPNDVVDDDDAYAEFLSGVGTAECRAKLTAVQREALLRRDEVVPMIEQLAAESNATFRIAGSADRAYELAIVELFWTFWQYGTEEDCADVPEAGAPLDELVAFIDGVIGLLNFADAGQVLGYPDIVEVSAPLADLLRYPGLDAPRHFVPESIPMQFQATAMQDIDTWVRERGQHLLFIYGQNDPWTAEPFRAGPGTADALFFVAPGGNHGSNIRRLAPADQVAAVAAVRIWAGLPPLDAAPSVRADSVLERIRDLVEATPLDGVDLFETRPRL
jgi:hypothetical protein